VTERDPFLRRFEHDALVVCLAMTLTAFAMPGGGWRAALAVVGGGLLAGSSYKTIKGGVDAVSGGGTRAVALVKVFTRYGILAVAAYVMLVRLRLHPVGVLTGVSSLVVAAAVAAARSLRMDSRSGPPRS
jgi:hypothetical protein